MLQPSYSPDLATCDFFLVQKVKTALKRRHYESTEDIQRSATQALNNNPTKCVPGMLQTMASPLEKVSASTRDVL
jgi:hypothetical protein